MKRGPPFRSFVVGVMLGLAVVSLFVVTLVGAITIMDKFFERPQTWELIPMTIEPPPSPRPLEQRIGAGG